MAVVLVVEDDLPVAQVLCRHLERRGHTALHAATASQALTIGASGRPNAAILDLRLPDGDGLTVFTFLKRHRPSIVCVMLTALGSVANAVASLQAGIADYIEKPTDLDQVITRIEHLLDAPLTAAPTERALAGPVLALRVARAVADVVNSPEPPKTLAEWGRSVGAARGTLRAWCYSVGVHPHDALALARGLWAVRKASRLGLPPAELLGFLDARSAREFVARSGVLRDAGQTITPIQYCREQQFCRHVVIIAELVRLLAEGPGQNA